MGLVDLKSELARLREAVEEALEQVLPASTVGPGKLTEAMRYSVQAGGKRIRPALALLWTQTAGGTLEEGLPSACALELVHTYSLIHDDLPAMDNDDLRRGRPTCHRKYGEATAILAGDALLTLAFEALTRESLPPERSVRLVKELARGAGFTGMVAGQAADLEGQQKPPDRKLVELIHHKKTAALIRAACRMGVIATGTDGTTLEQADAYGTSLGLLFQVTDDLLDESGTALELGKTPGKDRQQGKQTYPAAIGVEASRREAERLAGAATSALEHRSGDSAETLKQLVAYVLSRKN